MHLIGEWVKVQEAFDELLVYWNILVSRNSLEVWGVRFLIFLFILPSTQVITATMLFFQFDFVVILRWYSKKLDPKNFPGTIAVKDWAVLTRHSQIWHKAWSFDFKLVTFSGLFILIFHLGFRGMGSNNFRNSRYKEKTAGLTRVSRLPFRFLWLWYNLIEYGGNYSKTIGSLWQYYRYEPDVANENTVDFSADNNNSASFKFN